MIGRVLILNQNYEFLDICDWFSGFCLLIERNATPIAEYQDKIRSQYCAYNAPAVLVMNYYIPLKKKKNNFNIANKRNLLLRDNFECQYCGTKLSFGTATIDHVKPKVQGGSHTLDNTVSSCKSCNNNKGDMTAEQFGVWYCKKTSRVGYKLKNKPRALTEEEKIKSILRTVKSKERNAWMKCLDEYKISLW